MIELLLESCVDKSLLHMDMETVEEICSYWDNTLILREDGSAVILSNGFMPSALFEGFWFETAYAN